ncbi:hypothetical protein PFISCL1PPCAC_27926, partial [Pristionchus fissidentatus]
QYIATAMDREGTPESDLDSDLHDDVAGPMNPEPTGPDVITTMPEVVLTKIFSFLEGGKWQRFSAIKTISLTCSRFRHFAENPKNLKMLKNLRIDVKWMSIVQSEFGCGICLQGNSGKTFLVYRYENGEKNTTESGYNAIINLERREYKRGLPDEMKKDVDEI